MMNFQFPLLRRFDNNLQLALYKKFQSKTEIE